jgi:hypothetical protein
MGSSSEIEGGSHGRDVGESRSREGRGDQVGGRVGGLRFERCDGIERVAIRVDAINMDGEQANTG